MRFRLVFFGLLFVLAFSAPAFCRSIYTLESAHFLIHVPEGLLEYGKEVAKRAEYVHRILTEEFGYAPDKKTHVVILDQTDLPNGFADPLFMNRIGLYPVELLGYSYRSGLIPYRDWTELLLFHEYAHILHLDLHGGAAKTLRRIFGRIPGLTTPHNVQNFALIEGIAIWQETDKTEGGRQNAGFYPMFLDAVLDANLFLAGDQVLGPYGLSSFQPGDTYYFYGYLFVDYLIGTYGLATFYQFLYAIADTPSFMEQGLLAIYGKGFSELWQEMRGSLEKEKKDLPSPTVVTYLETKGSIQRSPRVQKEGVYLAYISDAPAGIRLYHLQSKEDRLLVPGIFSDASILTWVDSHTLLYGKVVPNLKGELRYDLFRYCLQEEKEERVTQGERAFGGTLLHGELLTLSRTKHGTQFSSYDLPPTLHPMYFSASPSGDLAFTAKFEGHLDVFLLEQGVLSRLTADSFSKGNPVFSPDGRYIFFDGNYLGRHTIFAYDRELDTFYQVVSPRYGAFSPAVTPCNLLIFMDFTATGYRLCSIPLDVSSWEKIELVKQEQEERSFPPVSLSVRPYSPSESLRPSFFLPLVEVEDEPVYGVFTAGKDALEGHAYRVFLGYGLESKAIQGALQYEYSIPTWFQPKLLATWSRGTVLYDETFHVRNQGSLLLTARVPRFSLGFGLEKNGQIDRDSLSLKGFLQYQTRTVRDGFHSTRLLRLEGEGALDRSAYILSHQEIWNLSSLQVRLRNTLGISNMEEGVFLGGTEGPFSLRGFAKEKVQNPYVLSLEFRSKVATLERGISYLPLFFQDVGLVFFCDQAYVSTYPSPLISVGMELELGMSLGFGVVSAIPKVGVVFTSEQSIPQLYVRMELAGFTF